MKMNDYQAFVIAGKIYPREQALTYTALGLCGESGEFAEKVKKLIRDGKWDSVEASRELGDILWYVAAAASELGMTLESVARMNMHKLRSRQERNVVQGSGDNR